MNISLYLNNQTLYQNQKDKSLTKTAYYNEPVIFFGKNIRVKNLNLKEYKRLSGQKVCHDTAEFKLTKSLQKLKTFSPKEYQTLSEQEKNVLRKEYSNLKNNEIVDFYPKMEKIHSITSDSIKDFLDKRYGEGNYAVITIGRSLSSIGKVLGYKIGEENVINIPMSRAYNYLQNSYLSQIENEGMIDKFRKFLSTQGLEKDKISKSDKQYVIMDYCFSGDSLKGATKLLTREDLLGGKNVTSLDVTECIQDSNIRAHLESGLMFCNYKKFSFVDFSHNLLESESAIINPSKADTETKLVWFKLLDNYMINPRTSCNVSKPSIWDSLRNFISRHREKNFERTVSKMMEYQYKPLN